MFMKYKERTERKPDRNILKMDPKKHNLIFH